MDLCGLLVADKPMKVKALLTEEQNKQFDACMLDWQARLNLMDWRIERGPGTAKGAMASVTTSYGARLATYRTGDWGSDPITPQSISATALHEMLHVLLAEMLCLKSSATAEPELLESAEHRVVNTLEKLLREPAK